MKQDVFAGAALFLPPEPESLDALDIEPTIIEGLVLKALSGRSAIVAGDLANELNLPYFNVLEPILERLRESKLIDVLRGDYQAISYLLSATDAGRDRAAQYFEQSAYVGPAPVSIQNYIQAIHTQTIRNIQINQRRLMGAFDGLIFEDEILRQIGPATNSGQSIFLYGPPGNGKTSIAERVVDAFGGAIFIPYCIEINGSIIRLFDDYNHKEVTAEDDPRLLQKYDRRWRLIKRPVIVVGGELGMESLDLIWSNESRFYEAPFQMKANGGCFMIDDFGRQRMDPKDLLNRWIVPLEKKIDYLALHTGIKIAVPFDVLLVISTNLDPRDLVDEAFLRRLRYKIPIGNPNEENFRKIWEMDSQKRGIPYSDEVVGYFLEKHMKPKGRPLRCCIPRDILELVMDSCRYNQVQITISPKLIDDAAEAYFVDLGEKLAANEGYIV
ncbi:MAG: AAA family ATPase [Methylacidiphilales bacterium]|nr:AAA family ATPase [Candidatus Methylacidiphilales bacterium]